MDDVPRRPRSGQSVDMEQLDVRKPFTRRSAHAHGIADGALRGPLFRTLVNGVYIAADVPDSPMLRIQATLLCFHETAFASHTSAARLYGVPLPPFPDEHVSVIVPGHRRKRAGLVCHYNPRPQLRMRSGCRVSAPCQLFVELATILSLVDLVVVGDHLVRKGLVSCTELATHCWESSLVGSPAARVAAKYVRERVDSPMETRLRMLFVLAGFPEPQVNVAIRDVNGILLRRYDLSWPEVKVIVEYDGRHHIERVEQWEADLLRREAIDNDEWRIIVVVASGIFKDPSQTLDRVFRVLQSRGLAGLPPRPRDDWRPHFPGQR